MKPQTNVEAVKFYVEIWDITSAHVGLLACRLEHVEACEVGGREGLEVGGG